MDPQKFIEPKEIKIEDTKFVISKIPAVQAQQIYRSVMQEAKDDGDIAMTYLLADTTIALLSYAAAVDGEVWVALDSESQINFWCSKLYNLIKLEAEMIRYNFGFLFDGTLQKVLGVLREGQAI